MDLSAFIGCFNGTLHFESANSGNGPAKPHQPYTIQLIGSSEVMDDPGNGFACPDMAHIVGELVILDNRPVFIFAFCGA
ncbi:MAG: hypothetical protein ABSG35_10865 [Syntrophobacteraceae bacterium]